MRPPCFSFASRLRASAPAQASAPAHAHDAMAPGPGFASGTPTSGPAVPALVPLLGARQRLQHTGAVLAWGLATAYFWLWWLEPHHNIGTIWFVLNSAVLGFFTLVPLYLLSLYIRGRVSALQVDPPVGRVAMVVTKAPSEPWSVTTIPGLPTKTLPRRRWRGAAHMGSGFRPAGASPPTIAPVGHAGPAARRAIWRTSMISLAMT